MVVGDEAAGHSIMPGWRYPSAIPPLVPRSFLCSHVAPCERYLTSVVDSGEHSGRAKEEEEHESHAKGRACAGGLSKALVREILPHPHQSFCLWFLDSLPRPSPTPSIPDVHGGSDWLALDSPE